MTDDPRPDHVAWIQQAMSDYEAPLLRYAGRLLRDPDLARDVVQDAFLRLCRARRDDVQDHLAQWLYTVCRNRAFELMRKDKRMTALDDTRLATSAADHPPPDHRLIRADDRSAALQLLDELPENQREVIRLKFQDGLSYREIAAITGLTESNVGYLIHMGIKAMRREFAVLTDSPQRQQVQP